VEELIRAGKMSEAGFESIETAKQNGSWISADEAEDLVVPAELLNELNKNHTAYDFFNSLTPKAQRNFLQYINLAKRKETREKRAKMLAGKFSENGFRRQLRSL
jgi:uncharacterized protein YdeI (YjbR/CyaY-like superfamily)